MAAIDSLVGGMLVNPLVPTYISTVLRKPKGLPLPALGIKN